MWFKRKKRLLSALKIGQDRYDVLQNSIETLNKAQNFLCPVHNSYGVQIVHNSLLNDAIQEKIDKLIDKREGLEV